MWRGASGAAGTRGDCVQRVAYHCVHSWGHCKNIRDKLISERFKKLVVSKIAYAQFRKIASAQSRSQVFFGGFKGTHSVKRFFRAALERGALVGGFRRRPHPLGFRFKPSLVGFRKLSGSFCGGLQTLRSEKRFPVLKGAHA